MNPSHEDEGRVEQNSSLRIKLFKEASRQGTLSNSEPGHSAREERDRRRSVRARVDARRASEPGLDS